ncbi:MAG: hypothetical protein V4727_04640 [Verrucomicrobiota bacterium]
MSFWCKKPSQTIDRTIIRMLVIWVLESPANDKLMANILAFELDEEEAQLPFTARLAREQGWTHFYAGRVVDEYKRFVVLAMLAGHPVTPSEQVDQAWHLHMVYTKNYWQKFCHDTLGRDLHHQPTQGGTHENDKFFDWYSKTLESYRRVFGTEPPNDIWPSPKDRFTDATASRWINTSNFWLIPKPVFIKHLFRK